MVPVSARLPEENVPFSCTEKSEFSVASPAKIKRVALLLDTSTRCRNQYGADFRSQILYMRLDGLTIDAIAAVFGCSDDLITAAISEWQEQITDRERRAGIMFVPRKRNRRRWKRLKRDIILPFS